MDIRQHWPYGVGVGLRTRLLRIGFGVILTGALILPAPAAAAAEEMTLTWDLAGQDATVDEHTAQLKP